MDRICTCIYRFTKMYVVFHKEVLRVISNEVETYLCTTNPIRKNSDSAKLADFNLNMSP